MLAGGFGPLDASTSALVLALYSQENSGSQLPDSIGIEGFDAIMLSEKFYSWSCLIPDERHRRSRPVGAPLNAAVNTATDQVTAAQKNLAAVTMQVAAAPKQVAALTPAAKAAAAKAAADQAAHEQALATLKSASVRLDRLKALLTLVRKDSK